MSELRRYSMYRSFATDKVSESDASWTVTTTVNKYTMVSEANRVIGENKTTKKKI